MKSKLEVISSQCTGKCDSCKYKTACKNLQKRPLKGKVYIKSEGGYSEVN